MIILKKLKSLAWAFLIGGLIALVGQLALTAFEAVLGSSPLLVPVWLLSMGFLGTVLFNLGIYPKLEKIGGCGAMINIPGLPSAIAGIIVGTKRSGGTVAKGFVASLKAIGLILLTGFVLTLALALLQFFIF